MKFSKTIVLAGAVLLMPFLLCGKSQIEANAFKDGQKISFVGDSITHGGYYQKFITLFYATRFPEMKLEYENRGISGNSRHNLIARLDSDIMQPKPDIFTLMIGMNDVGRPWFTKEKRAKDPKSDEIIARRAESYKKNMPFLIDALAKNSQKTYVFSPSIFDETSNVKYAPSKGLNAKLGEYGKICADIAKSRKNVEFVDMWGEMTRINSVYQKCEGRDVSIIGGDRVHPTNKGGFVMAAIFVKTFGETPYVSSAEITDDSKNKAFNCEISNVKYTKKGATFDILEFALPMAIKDEEKKIARYVDFYNSLNRQILKVKKLNAGKYTLKIDGESVGIFSAKQLADGINLSEYDTPQIRRALKIYDICENIRIANNKLRNIKQMDLQEWLKLDGKPTQERIAIVEDALANKMKNEHIKYLAKIYIKEKPKQPEIENATREYYRKICEISKPKTHSYSITQTK
jgi:lipolytic enzyme, G-D-S-L